MPLTLLRITKGYMSIIKWAWLNSFIRWYDTRYDSFRRPWQRHPFDGIPTTTEVRKCFPDPNDENPVVYLLPEFMRKGAA